MVLFLAGMQHIQDEYYEAASLDGAGAFQQFIHITVPGLRAEIAVALVTTIIAALRVFDLVYTTTRGGPGESTMVTGFLIYRAAFTTNRIGYAAAIATVLTVIILAISLVIRRFQRTGGGERVKYPWKKLLPRYLILIVFMLVVLVPVWGMFTSAFKTSTEVIEGHFSLPTQWSLNNFEQAWRVGRFNIFFKNSVIVATRL